MKFDDTPSREEREDFWLEIGQEYTVAQALSKIAGGVTFVNSVASTVCAVILYLALRPALERASLLPKGEKH